MNPEDEIVRQRLYRIFRLEDENYMITMKVMYVYHWVDKRTPEGVNPFDVITDLRQIYKYRKNVDRLNMLFRHMQSINLERYAAPIDAKPPEQPPGYSSGWKVG